MDLFFIVVVVAILGASAWYLGGSKPLNFILLVFWGNCWLDRGDTSNTKRPGRGGHLHEGRNGLGCPYHRLSRCAYRAGIPETYTIGLTQRTLCGKVGADCNSLLARWSGNLYLAAIWCLRRRLTTGCGRPAAELERCAYTTSLNLPFVAQESPRQCCRRGPARRAVEGGYAAVGFGDDP